MTYPKVLAWVWMAFFSAMVAATVSSLAMHYPVAAVSACLVVTAILAVGALELHTSGAFEMPPWGDTLARGVFGASVSGLLLVLGGCAAYQGYHDHGKAVLYGSVVFGIGAFLATSWAVSEIFDLF